ncbi:MAG TPA: helix-turn-helix transcriptional regulator [Candidatus Angelobacter sp.]
MEDINKQVGKRILELRVSKGFSQEGLADSSGIHRSHMGEIERGELNVTLKTLEKVGLALKVPVLDFLKGIGSARREVIK